MTRQCQSGMQTRRLLAVLGNATGSRYRRPDRTKHTKEGERVGPIPTLLQIALHMVARLGKESIRSSLDHRDFVDKGVYMYTYKCMGSR